MSYNENPSYAATTVPVPATAGGTGVVNGVGSTITLGGALDVLGAFATNITVTGVTNVTLPTSGTLAVVTTKPAFFAYLNTTRSNVTGDGTVYDIVYDEVVYDQLSNFNVSTGVFTAPVAGVYLFSATAFLLGLSAAFTVGILQINTTSNSYIIAYDNVGVVGTGSEFYQAGGSCVLAQMAMGDTAFVSIQVGGSTKTVSVNSSTSPFQTYFTGAKLV